MGKLILMVGVPGSGKSTYIQNHFHFPFICSADHYMVDDAGNYEFNPNRLGYCHNCCQDAAAWAVEHDYPIVVVDNTNIKQRDRKFYVDLAKKHGYEVEIHALPYDDRLIGRNTHGAGEDVIWRMATSCDLEFGHVYSVVVPPFTSVYVPPVVTTIIGDIPLSEIGLS